MFEEALNFPLVQDIYEVVRGDCLLRPTEHSRRTAPERFTVLESEDDAYSRIGSGVLMKYPMSNAGGALLEVPWHNIQSDQAASISELCREAGVQEIAKRLTAFGPFEELIEAHLPEEYSDFIDTVSADLADCIKARLAVGQANPWVESLVEAYHLGGLPCGWDHECQRLVVFMPQN
jgi:hypothetical protein